MPGDVAGGPEEEGDDESCFWGQLQGWEVVLRNRSSGRARGRGKHGGKREAASRADLEPVAYEPISRYAAMAASSGLPRTPNF